MKSLTDNSMDESTQKAVTAFMGRISALYPVRQAILFGSRARGDFSSSSDVDIAILLGGKPGSFLDTKLTMADIAYDVLLETGLRIQPLPIWQEEWDRPESYSNPRLLHNIEREGVLL